MKRLLSAAAAVGLLFPGAVANPHEFDPTLQTPRSTHHEGYHDKPIPLEEMEGDLREFSVVYTDRATNHMSRKFQEVMKDLNRLLKEAYHAHLAVLIPGSGTFAMEAVARQLIPSLGGKEGDKPKILVVRNGFFSYRWTDILTQTGLAAEHVVIKARPVVGQEESETPAFAPPPVEEVVARIKSEMPSVVFAPHVETSTGILLPDDYIKEISKAVQEVGGYFVLDGIAAGFKWANMKDLGCDFYLSAPQKAWTAPAGAGVVMMSKRGYDRVSETTSDSMAMNLRKWRDVMESYLAPKGPGFSYYTTMPTDVLTLFRNAAHETKQKLGWASAEEQFQEQGTAVYELLEEKYKMKIVAAKGYRAPGVVVAYSPKSKNMPAEFKERQLQIAAGVPFQLGEKGVLGTFRLGLFGLDKLYSHHETLGHLDSALWNIIGDAKEEESMSIQTEL